MGSRWVAGFFLAVVIVVLGGLLYVGYFVSTIVRPASTSTALITFAINKGDHVHEISQKLLDAGLIQSKWDFEVYIWLRRWGGRLQAGEYVFPKNITIRDLSEILALGKSASVESNVTLIEGWTLDDIADFLEQEGVVRASDFKAAADSLKTKQPITAIADKPASASLEGYLFPDTYRIYRGSSADDVVNRLLQNFEERLTEDLRAVIKKQDQKIFEVVTMASILEKEVKQQEDMMIVADIFYRRLKAGKTLESDATLNYVLENKTSQLSASDLKNISPYNSYRYKGLPPGPICNPGLRAIRAALYPQSNDYWFFLTTKSGKTIYARTYQEHLANKRMFLQ